MKKGSRAGGPYPGSLRRYMEHINDVNPVCPKCGYHACECPSGLQKDLQEMIKDIENGKYGEPDQWEKLRADLVGLL